MLVRGHEGFAALVGVDFGLGAVQVAGAGVAVAEGDAGGELGAVEEGVGCFADTGGIVVALVVVAEGAPFGACVYDVGLEDETTVAADGVAGAASVIHVLVVFKEITGILGGTKDYVLFNQVWRVDLTIRADELDRELRSILLLLR